MMHKTDNDAHNNAAIQTTGNDTDKMLCRDADDEVTQQPNTMQPTDNNADNR
jgi:hypothetical protein